jgi:hypothetical protein
VFASGLTVGCLPDEPHAKKGAKPKEKPTPTGVVNSLGGSSDIYSTGAKRVELWTVSWQQMAVKLGKDGVSEGRMHGVHATIYRGSGDGVTVSSEYGSGDKLDSKHKMLELTGNVTVRSKDKKSVLTCNSLRYDPSTRLLYASGNVLFKNPVGSIGTFSQLLATSDLKKVGTPDEFNLP